MKFGIVSRITQGAFRYQAWPTVTRGTDGTIFAGVSGHRLNHICPFGKDLMYISTDEGKSWTAPQIINDTYLDDRDAGMLAWGEGNLLLTWFDHTPENFLQWEAPKRQYTTTTPLAMGMRQLWAELPEEELPAGSFTKISRDNGKTWSEGRRAPVSSPHGPCLLQDGSLLFVGSYVEETEYETDDYANHIRAFRSFDDGETWEFCSILPVPEGSLGYVCEPHAIQMANGDILAAVRDQSATPPTMKTLRLYTMISHDLGKTWEEVKFLDVHGAPAHMLQHSSGAIVLTYSRRLAPMMGQYARISRDFGKTWSKDLLISPEAPDWDHGYPSSVELSDGSILTVYYQKYQGDTYNSLLSTHWDLSEIE
jgi:hypothetical protein